MTVRDVDVVVVGGGVIGSAAAWQLALRGLDVVLLERFGPGHVRGASHGASRIFRVSYPDEVHIRLAQEALELWRELEDITWSALLTITGGVEHGDHPYLDELADGLARAGVAREWLSPAEAADRWPGLRFDARVLFHPGSGRLHADRSVAALQAAAVKQGALVRHHARVTAVTVRGDADVEIVLDAAGASSGLATAAADGLVDRYRARRVVIAAGAWTQALLGGLLPLPPLRVTQEQPAYFAPRRSASGAGGTGGAGGAGRLGSASPAGGGWHEEWPGDWPTFGHLLAPGSDDGLAYNGGVYGLATPGEGVKIGFHRVGPVVDPEHRDFRPEPEQLDALRRYVAAWVPGADPDDLVPISCTYTSTPDSVFVLDRHGPLVVAAGFSGHGFKFAPAVGRILADLAVDGRPTDPRFSSRR
ncbi:FAD-dependent oxidoreductase [Parafrankia sp. EUN1f]|uniref:FAD-dependent oxidoreductase n=1 Tax=Parafrankia sp. EUN1f TaxID=102897 RepID=UPI0001C46BAC|nr:FAD-dependent oxidoreductase [Parafrankia sp. EUN1f]EFC82662.1 Sarcosine oxidase [Parafrankia sp. EUN1f]